MDSVVPPKNQNIYKGQTEEERPKRKKRRLLWILFLIIIVVVVGLFSRAGVTFSVITGGAFWRKEAELPEKKHFSDPNRLNVLLLGIRGEADPHGGLLSDTTMLISIHKPTKRIAIFSIPRDLYVDIPDHKKREKINFAYALGFERGGWKEGLRLAKETVEDVTDVVIDYAAVVDFAAFEEIVDTLGGIDVYVRQDFKETKQFSEYPLKLKKGIHHMDGQTALYYVRSRYSTSDFDRARRQQDVVIAIKDKAFKLGVLANPKKVLSILGSVERHVRTDANIGLLDDMLSLARGTSDSRLARMVFDTSSDGLLESAMINDIYVLLPKDGNFYRLQETIKNIFNEANSEFGEENQ